jgi:hypothetical protein
MMRHPTSPRAARPSSARLLLAIPLALGLGCSAASGGHGFTGTGGGGAGGASTTTTTDNLGGGLIATGGSGGGTGGSAGDARVYAQSASTLYRLDPNTKAVTTVGPFSGCGGDVIDIAVDKDGVMYAATTGTLNRVDTATAKCSFVAFGIYPNSLSFVPKGTVDPNEEALVGYNGDVYVRIDKTTGTETPIGSLGGGYASSGDIVSVIGGGTYLTVYGNGCSDCIVEVDPKTGAMKKMIGSVGHADVYGLAFWAGSAYGFDDAGELFQIDLGTGQTTPITMPQKPAGLRFWGAGSTTSAPLEPPH